MRKTQWAMLGLLGITGAALASTQPVEKARCGCETPKDRAMQKGFTASFGALSQMLRSGYAYMTNTPPPLDADATGYCSTAYITNHLLWKTESVVARPVAVPQENLVQQV